MACENGIIHTNDPDRPVIQCQHCAELEQRNESLAETVRLLGEEVDKNQQKLAEAKARNTDLVKQRTEQVDTIARLRGERNAAEQKLDKASKRESGMVAREIEREGELAAAKQELTALREASEAVTQYLTWHDDEAHYTEVDHSKLVALKNALNKGGE